MSVVLRFELVGGKCVEGFMSGKRDNEGGGTPSGNAWVADAKDACGLAGSPDAAGFVIGGYEAPGAAPKRLNGMDWMSDSRWCIRSSSVAARLSSQVPKSA